MNDSICDDCKHSYKVSDEKPCSTCMQWDFDGYLDARNYEPKVTK